MSGSKNTEQQIIDAFYDDVIEAFNSEFKDLIGGAVMVDSLADMDLGRAVCNYVRHWARVSKDHQPPRLRASLRRILAKRVEPSEN